MGIYAHPIFHPDGDYPQVVKDRVAARSKKEGFQRSRLPSFTTKEIADIKGTFDYFSINHYSSTYVEAAEEPEVGEISSSNDVLAYGMEYLSVF